MPRRARPSAIAPTAIAASAKYLAVACLLALGTVAAPARAADAPTYTLTLKDHRFTPGQLSVPAGTRFRITLDNQDGSVSEFESYDMKFEKIVVGGGKATVWAGPLHPGTYKFFDDYHPDKATGTIVATAPAAKE